MPNKSSKKSSAKTGAKAEKAADTSVVAFAQLDPNASTKSLESMEKVMNSSKAQYAKMSNDATEVGRQGMDAFMRSGNILAKGTEQIFKAMAEIAQASTERNTEAFKTLLSCKTLNELTEAQNRIAQENFDEVMTAGTRLSELSIKLATEMFEPINDQMTQSMRKASEAMAA